MKEGRKPEYPEKTPGDEFQKMPHTTARRFKPPARLKHAQKHWWQARKADMLTVTFHASSTLVYQCFSVAQLLETSMTKRVFLGITTSLA